MLIKGGRALPLPPVFSVCIKRFTKKKQQIWAGM